MIDLDGVLNNYEKYEKQHIPQIREGAAEFLEKLRHFNCYELILFTTREEKLCKKWLEENKIEHYFSEITNIKKPASIYLDDRALKFNGDFNVTFEEIKNFDVYWKKSSTNY